MNSCAEWQPVQGMDERMDPIKYGDLSSRRSWGTWEGAMADFNPGATPSIPPPLPRGLLNIGDDAELPLSYCCFEVNQKESLNNNREIGWNGAPLIVTATS